MVELKKLELKDVKPFILKWHYSEKIPTGKNIYFGWFLDNELYAVADYGIGVNSYQAKFLSRITGKDVTNTNLLELKRLCRREPKIDEMPLSSFLSKCHKELKKLGYKYIVSFSDPAHGHSGGIYKASNFIYLGKTNEEDHTIDSEGNIRHRRYYFRYARRNNISMKQAREELGLKFIKTLPKDRWFLML